MVSFRCIDLGAKILKDMEVPGELPGTLPKTAALCPEKAVLQALCLRFQLWSSSALSRWLRQASPAWILRVCLPPCLGIQFSAIILGGLVESKEVQLQAPELPAHVLDDLEMPQAC